MAKLIWRVKLVAEFETGETTEAEVARLDRDEQAGLADLGLRLAEAKQLLAPPEPWQGQATRRRTRTDTSPNRERSAAV